MTTKQLEDAFYALCKAQDWKCTIQRRAVFNFIAGNMKHPSVEEVCAAVRKTVPNISTDSVYRILNDFASTGFLLRLEGCGRSHFDPNTAEHDHFYCLRCGHVYDLSGEGLRIPKDRYEAFGEVQFCEVRVTGTCRSCLDLQNKQKELKKNIQKPGVEKDSSAKKQKENKNGTVP